MGQLSLYFGSATVLFSGEPSQVPRAVAATTATTATTTTNCCHDRPTFMNVLFLYFGHAAFCYTISIKAAAAVLEKPVKRAAGIPERNLLYLAPRVWSVALAPAPAPAAAAAAALYLAAAASYAVAHRWLLRQAATAGVAVNFPF